MHIHVSLIFSFHTDSSIFAFYSAMYLGNPFISVKYFCFNGSTVSYGYMSPKVTCF